MKMKRLITMNNVVGKQCSFILLIVLFLLVISTQASSQVLSNSAVKPITKAQEMMGEGEFIQAVENLTEFLAKDRFKNYDRAKALQLLAIAYMNLEDNQSAVETIEQALSLNALETVSASQLRKNLFSLYAMMENYTQAIKHLEIWFDNQETPSTESYFLVGRIYGLSERWEKASEFVEKGYMLASQVDGVVPERSWLELTLAVRMQLNNYEAARTLLEEMLSYWPDRYSYYQQLSGVYHTLKLEKEAFAIMSIAKQNTLVDSKNDLERLVQLNRYFENPYPAAHILQEIKTKKYFEENDLFFENLANTWMQAREWEQAESALYHAAKLSDKGEHWLRLCQTNFQRDSLENALQYCDAAIVKGGLKKEESVAWYLLALSKHRLEDINGARQAFIQCVELDMGNSACENWLDIYAKNEEKTQREKQLLREAEARSKRDKQEQNDRIDNALNKLI